MGDFDDWVYENLKNTILLTNQQIQKLGLSEKEIQTVRVPPNTKKFEGEKNVYVCGNTLHDSLYRVCQFENWMRKKNKDKPVSFADFIERIIRRAVNAILQDYLVQSLDSEKDALKKSNKKPK